MKNRVYYGEYSLKHWIDLMLSGNIVLPEYQREFVWETRDIKRLIKSLKEGQFIMPVTIAQYAPNGEEPKNLLLDGQQRLSSILLAWLGYEPNKSKFKASESFAGEDDSAKEDIDLEKSDKPQAIAWKFEELVKFKKRTKEELVNAIKEENEKEKEKVEKKEKDKGKKDTNDKTRYNKYNELEGELFKDINDDFLNNTFLGFSYIVPNSKENIQNDFSQLFRNINYFGKKLSPLESRRSLYYMNTELKNFFEGKTTKGEECFGCTKIMDDTMAKQIDFVRYLAILSQKHIKTIPLVGYSAYSSRESFYADYVSYILGMEQESRIDKFNEFKFEETFPENCWKQRYDKLLSEIQKLKDKMQLNDKNAYLSIIDADYWLFGLIYCVVFEGKVLKDDTVDVLCKKIAEEILSKKGPDKEENKNADQKAYSRTPNLLGHTRERINESIKIYQNYVREPTL